jgi:hypothetical protein
MQRLTRAAAVALLLLSSGAAVHGQQIQWKQTTDTPKGLNLPKDIRGDILGIELGDTYAQVKPKLQQLLGEALPQPKSSGMSGPAAEIMGNVPDNPIAEATMQMRLQVPGGSVDASYPGQLTMTRKLKGSTQQPVQDTLEIVFSAPSSGQQVLGIKRVVHYFAQGDQTRVSDLLAALKAKYKAEPQKVADFRWRLVFDDGRNYVQPSNVRVTDECRPQYSMQGQVQDAASIINPTGVCDVVLQVEIKFGISNDHAEMVTFILSDNERAKRNMTADLAFLQGYVRDLQSRTKGNTPKL